MKSNFIILAFIGLISVQAVKLEFMPEEQAAPKAAPPAPKPVVKPPPPAPKEDNVPDNGSVLSETMKSLKESEKLLGSKMEAPVKEANKQYDGIGAPTPLSLVE